MAIFILLSWDNIYYIITSKGDDVFSYFKVKKYKRCVLHNSYKCDCKKELIRQDLEPIIENYIQFYKFCSSIVTISDGKIKYIKMKSKYNFITEEAL